jgi:hypothetical protein
LKDLLYPQLGVQEAHLIKRSFQADAIAINLGCGGSSNAKEILRKNITICNFSEEELEFLVQVGSTCWHQLIANACHSPCYGAYPGFPTCLEYSQKMPTLGVPQKKILDRLDYSKILIYLQQKLNLKLDPWGLGLIRFQPRQELAAI